MVREGDAAVTQVFRKTQCVRKTLSKSINVALLDSCVNIEKKRFSIVLTLAAKCYSVLRNGRKFVPSNRQPAAARSVYAPVAHHDLGAF